MPSSQKILDDLLNYQAPRWDAFPEIHLYMDQVVEILNHWLTPLYFDQEKPCITPSMINNYVKNSIVKPPQKKKYKAYHLAFLYVVMVLKQSFSLQEISALITIYSSMESNQQIQEDFNRFASVFEEILHQVFRQEQVHDDFFQNPTWEKSLMVDVLQAVCCKLYGVYQIQAFQQGHLPSSRKRSKQLESSLALG